MDRHLHEPGKGQPPTFAPGDVVEVTRLTAQQLIGMGKAEYYAGPAVIEPAAYEPQIETAEVEPPESAVTRRGKRAR